MTNVIKLKKGLDINLKGKPEEKMLDAAKSEYFVMVPDDFCRTSAAYPPILYRLL